MVFTDYYGKIGLGTLWIWGYLSAAGYHDRCAGWYQPFRRKRTSLWSIYCNVLYAAHADGIYAVAVFPVFQEAYLGYDAPRYHVDQYGSGTCDTESKDKGNDFKTDAGVTCAAVHMVKYAYGLEKY